MKRVAAFIIAIAAGMCIGAISKGEMPGLGERNLRSGRFTATEKERATAEMAGLTEVEGAGVVITITDAAGGSSGDISVERLIVHERDLVRLRNELFAGGAKAVSINGERLIATTAIRCAGPVIRINDAPTAPPYVIEAAGDPQVLKSAVTMMGGVFDLLTREGLKVEIAVKSDLKIPAYEISPAGEKTAEDEG